MATQAWWPLVLAAQQRRMGGGMMPDRPAHLQAEPDWLMSRVEEYWVGPCSAKLPEIMHGMCIVVPAASLCLCLVLIVVLLKWLDERKAKSALKKKE
mmetsp:Transcript_16129/g.38519  ORF Transcript_16129/g.38519 Transcript_16129/m.38519 type:complete len:97 (+) Transcript_16129:54-344(+)